MDAPQTSAVNTERRRLSVSAIRDYQRCPRMYYYKRVEKLPDPMSHHAPAGTLVHNCFYAAYGRPVEVADPITMQLKTRWEVTGEFSPDLALALFDMFWAREDYEASFDDLLVHVVDIKPVDLAEDKKEKLRYLFDTLSHEIEVIKNFRPGQLAALGKGKKFTQAQLKEGWGGHFRKMLAGILEEPLEHPIKEIEREVHWRQGETDMLGYLDVVLDASEKFGVEGAEIGLDLKTGYNKPQARELSLDDQMLGYYEASIYNGDDMREFYFWHVRSNTMFLVEDDPEIRELLRHTTQQVSFKIREEDFTPRYDKSNCSMCTYLKQCRSRSLIGNGPYEQMKDPPRDVPVVLF